MTSPPTPPTPPSAPAPVVLVPGLGLGEESWVPTIRGLHAAGVADPVRTSTALLPGFGRPAAPGASLAPADLAPLLLAQVGPDPVVLVALSAGCQVAVHAAARAPERFLAVVLVGPTTDPRGGTWPRLVARWLATAVHESLRQVPALLRQYRRTGLRSMTRAMDAARTDHIEAVVALLGVPVLLVRGEHDAIAPAAWLAQLAAGTGTGPGAGAGTGERPVAPRHRATVAGGAHMVTWTHGGQLAQVVAAFLRLRVC